jgi:hypothetical protein
MLMYNIVYFRFYSSRGGTIHGTTERAEVFRSKTVADPESTKRLLYQCVSHKVHFIKTRVLPLTFRRLTITHV